MLAVLVTTNRNTFDVVLIIAAVLFFISALLHIYRQPNPFPPQAIAFTLGMLGATALAIALLFF
jgi:CHASE2 domain-containing sensor protein